MKSLEEISNTIENSINELKEIFEKIQKNKEELKLKIQNIFTKIRSTLNDREDALLMEVDNIFDFLYFKEDHIKKSEKLPNKIKESLEIGNNMNNKWNNNEDLSLLINDCINIESNINDIYIMNDNIKKNNNSINKKIYFNPQEDNELNEFLEKIKNFGIINKNFQIYKFKPCPNNLKEERKYSLSGDNQNTITKTGGNEKYTIGLCEQLLVKGYVYRWTIKIIKSIKNNINIGVVPNSSTIDIDKPYKYGYLLYCNDMTFYSGPPHSYNGKKTNLKKMKDSIVVILDMIKGTLKFIVDGDENADYYSDIPLDKPLVPIITLYNINDSLQILNCD